MRENPPEGGYSMRTLCIVAPDIDVAGDLLFECDLSLFTLDDERRKSLVDFDRDARCHAERREFLDPRELARADIGDASGFSDRKAIDRYHD